MNTDGLPELIGRLTLERKVSLLTGRDSWSLHALPEIGLQSISFSDGPAGVRGTVWDERHPSVSFPSPTATAASWDPALVERVGAVMGQQARDKGVHVLLAPTINLQRSPLAGRHFENYSEDPFLTGALATAFVRGVQRQGVAATVKHYVANDSETERFTVDVRVDERTLREVYLAAFEEPVVTGGAWVVMSAYNAINAVTASENTLLTTPLRDEWGFDGVVVSDWTAVRSLESARHPQDLVMPGPSDVWGTRLVESVRAGDIEESVVDDKVIRVLRLAERVGALGGGGRRAARPGSTADARSVAREACVAGMVLLKNDGALPVGAPPRTVALIGEGAVAARIQGGGSATVVPEAVVSPLEGLRGRWPEADVCWARGAVVQQTLAELPLERMTTPQGEPGLQVRYLDGAGAKLATEVRQTSVLVWFGGDTLPQRTEAVELALTYRPEAVEGDRTAFAVAGLADVDVWADGDLVTSLRLRTDPGDDPATVVLNPPWAVVDVPASPGGVSLVVRFRPASGGIPDAMSLRIGTPPSARDGDELIAEAVSAARTAELAVVVVGTSAEVESEGFDRTTLGLPGRQDDLVRAVASANPRCLVVVNAGAPVSLPWRDAVPAVLAVWFPGQEFGLALASVLSGDEEPGGRLPVTWPGEVDGSPILSVTPVDGVLSYHEGVHVGHRQWEQRGIEPAYWFGHGLGYTSWRVEGATASAFDPADGVVVEATISNTGDRHGTTLLQVYLQRVSPSSLDRPSRWLAGFGKVNVPSGGTQRICVSVPPRRFAHWDGAGWAVEPGSWELRVGLSFGDALTARPLDVET